MVLAMNKGKLQHILDTGTTNEQVIVLELEYIQTQLNVLSHNHQKLEKAILGLMEATKSLTTQFKRLGYLISGAIVLGVVVASTDMSLLTWKNVMLVASVFL